jgi:hypothetical protein
MDQREKKKDDKLTATASLRSMKRIKTPKIRAAKKSKITRS